MNIKKKLLLLSVMILIVFIIVGKIFSLNYNNTMLGMVTFLITMIPILILGFIYSNEIKRKNFFLSIAIKFAVFLFAFTTIIIFIIAFNDLK